MGKIGDFRQWILQLNYYDSSFLWVYGYFWFFSLVFRVLSIVLRRCASGFGFIASMSKFHYFSNSTIEKVHLFFVNTVG